MPRKESSYPDDWFELARKERLRSQRLLEFDDLEPAFAAATRLLSRLLEASGKD